MKLKLSDFASIAEIVAAIGVIISLIFVGMQVNESSNETRAATIQAAADAESFMLVTLITHASTWDKVVVGAPLETGEENRRAILLFNLMMTENENRYRQFQSGYLDSQSWESRLSNLRSIVKLPIFESWRFSYGGKGHSTEFLTLIDELVVEPQTE
jgi:hypothetical protein